MNPKLFEVPNIQVHQSVVTKAQAWEMVRLQAGKISGSRVGSESSNANVMTLNGKSSKGKAVGGESIKSRTKVKISTMRVET